MDELTREQILDLADANGRKLGFLLATADLDEEIKEALLQILESATAEQISALTDMLEEEFMSAYNQNLVEFLREQLQTIKEDDENARGELEGETLEKLSQVEKKLSDSK